MKIVIEGMDGVGKSTVAQKLAQRLCAKYEDGLMINFFREEGMTKEETEILKKAIDICSKNENSIIRTWVYGFANLFNLLHYKEDVVIDRHCLTTYFYNADDKSREIYRFMQKIMGKPEYIFILRASVDTRRKRICKRSISDPDLLDKKKMQYGYDKLEEAAQYLNLDYRILDTDDKDVDMVVDEIMKILKEENHGIMLADNGMV